jgi:general secretion pathway protein L
MKPIRLILIPSLGSEPAPCLVIADGVVRERGLLNLHPDERPEPMRTIAVAPGADVTIRWLDLAAGGAAQQRAAAQWMLKDALAVALVGLPLLQAWVDYLEALGVRADAIVPDVLTVPEPAEDDRLNAVTFGPSTALRGRRFAASVQPDLVELVAGARPIHAIQDTDAVERSLVAAAVSPPINLLTGQERAHGSPRQVWTRAAAMAGLLLVSPLVLIAAAAARDEASARADTDRARAEIARVAPDLAAAAYPVEALRQRVRAAPPPGGVAGATAALFAAVEGVEGAELDLLIVDPVNGMKASITHTDYGDTRRIAEAMRANGLEVTETGTLDDRGRIVSDITIGGGR